MGASFGLVKFKKTGNIYYGCYEGISDIMIPFICTPKECYNEQNNCYHPIIYCRTLDSQYKTYNFPDVVADLDDIEIYSDYCGGFYWSGTGSESIKMIKNYLNPLIEVYSDIKYGKPNWVKEFLDLLD